VDWPNAGAAGVAGAAKALPNAEVLPAPPWVCCPNVVAVPKLPPNTLVLPPAALLAVDVPNALPGDAAAPKPVLLGVPNVAD
jgi:hypothetical protein